jgi:hypothetical protein
MVEVMVIQDMGVMAVMEIRDTEVMVITAVSTEVMVD